MTIVQLLARRAVRAISRPHALLGAALLAAPLGAMAPAAPQDGALPRYVRAKEGAKVRNFQDLQGLAFAELRANDLLQVHSQSRGAVRFYEVSAPAGFPVWVFGKYLDETGADGVLRVTGSHVNMRPRPDSSAASMPLRARLMTGDRVAFLARRDPALSMGQDWVKVWSPETARAWIRVEDTVEVDSMTAAASEYQAGKRDLKSVPAAKSKAATEAASGPPKPKPEVVSEAAIKALQAADLMLEEATAKEAPTAGELGQVEAAYSKVLVLAPAESHTYKLAQQQLERVTILRGLADLRTELRAAKEAGAKRLDELAQEQSKAELKKTASWGRFHSRGWLEHEESGKDQHRYYLRWDGERKAEIVCGQGRYNLDAYVGFQLGVQGHTRRAAVAASLEGPAEPQVLDVYKVEVVAGGTRRKGR